MAVPSGPLFCLRSVFSVPCPVLQGQLGLDSRPLRKGDGGDRLEEPGNALPFSAARLPWGLSLAALWGPQVRAQPARCPGGLGLHCTEAALTISAWSLLI